MIRLRELRKNKEMKITNLAMELGISTQVLSRYEREERQADYSMLKKLADYFNVSIDYLLGRTDKRGFAPSEQETGYTTTPTLQLNEKEFEMMAAYREIGNSKNGEAHQALIRKFVADIFEITQNEN